MKPLNIDTIAAVSTPFGEGGIGIVRMSGNDAMAIAAKIFRPADGGSLLSYASHTVHYGKVTDPSDGLAVDEALLTVMRGPSTYTKEDVVEINCHGGKATLKKVLELCLAKGARLAEPGEFTKRAFLGGRIDLSQAEAVLDVIKAETDIARSVAMRCLEGEFSKEIKALRERVMDVIAMAELSIDFSQEDVEFPREASVSGELKEILSSVKAMFDSYGRGMVIREGASVVICGRPNVGKSSLMNALLRHDRVIVTPIAGTTRDVIEESIDIKGVKVRLSDTAGIIETRDRVEIEGIKRSRKKLEEADVVIFVLDSSQPFSPWDAEIYETVKHKKTIVVANKTDLARKLDIDDASRRLGGARLIEASNVLREGLLEIENAMAERLLGGAGKIDKEIIVTNARHKDLLEKAAVCVERALNTASTDHKGELIASDLNEAVHDLGLIIGESIDADVLDRIFSRFCIGK